MNVQYDPIILHNISTSNRSKWKMRQNCKLKNLFFMSIGVLTLTLIRNMTLLHTPRMTQVTEFIGNLFAPKDVDIKCLNMTTWDNDIIEAFNRLKERGIISCDYDYLHLQSQLQRWPEDKPKAFIYFLIRFENLQRLITSLTLLDMYFNNKFQYPIVIFHEKESSYDALRLKIRSSTNSTVYFQLVSFEMPEFLPKNLTQRFCTWRLGYRHMCSFHAKLIYEQVIIRGFEFSWRLDDDSEILRPIHYDVFQFMRNNSFQYGYVMVVNEDPSCTVNLWESVEFYIRNTTTNTTFFEQLQKYSMFYNNFEISRLSLWFSADYQNYIQYIDGLGGIYYNRWGDAPIKSLAVSMFVPWNQTYHFKDIGYRHQGSTN